MTTSTQSSTVTSTAVILASPKDWKDWIHVIQTASNKANVWKYLDPLVLDDKLPILNEPVYPTF